MGETFSPGMVELRDLLLTEMPSGVTYKPEILDTLKSWSGNMDADRYEPLIMVAWQRNLLKGILSDDLGKHYDLIVSRSKMQALLSLIEDGGARDWCHDRIQDKAQSCGEVIAAAFKAAIEELTAEYGSDWKSWRWGKAHMALGEHRPFSNVGPLKSLFEVNVESEGSALALRRGQNDFSKDEPYLSRHASVYRAVYDIANLEQSLFMISTGQSGHFLSDYYRHFAGKWAKMEFVKIPTEKSEYSKNAIGVWKLTP